MARLDDTITNQIFVMIKYNMEQSDNIIDRLKAEHNNNETAKVIDAMNILLDKVLKGAKEVIRASISDDQERAVLFICMEDVEIEKYPIKFLLGMEKFNGKDITTYVDSGFDLIQRYIKKLDNKINTKIRPINEHIIIEIDWASEPPK